jgi:hypothetical protein
VQQQNFRSTFFCLGSRRTKRYNQVLWLGSRTNHKAATNIAIIFQIPQEFKSHSRQQQTNDNTAAIIRAKVLNIYAHAWLVLNKVEMIGSVHTELLKHPMCSNYRRILEVGAYWLAQTTIQPLIQELYKLLLRV